MATTRKTKPQITTLAQAVQAALAADAEPVETAEPDSDD